MTTSTHGYHGYELVLHHDSDDRYQVTIFDPNNHRVASTGTHALTMLAAVSRAREAGRRDADRPARAVQRQLAARFDGEVAGGAVADSFFVISGSGRRWSSGGRGDR
jgi:hypothetical protein